MQPRRCLPIYLQWDFAQRMGRGRVPLPPWDDRWAEQGFEILQRNDKYWKSLRRAANGLGIRGSGG